MGTEFSVDITLTWGAGVGEETALIESLEGNRGMPRLKPPFFPAAIGLYGLPDRQQCRDAEQPSLAARQRSEQHKAFGSEASTVRHGRRVGMNVPACTRSSRASDFP